MSTYKNVGHNLIQINSTCCTYFHENVNDNSNGSNAKNTPNNMNIYTAHGVKSYTKGCLAN